MSADAILDDLYNPEAAGWTSGKVRQLIVDESRRQGVDPALMLSIAHQESRFQPSAVSPTGVVGVFQVTQETGEKYGQPRQNVDRANPAYSVPAGIAYMKDLLTQTKGNVPEALMRYNGGSDPQYAQHVLSRYRLHQEGPGAQAKVMDAESILNDLYGPTQGAQAPAPPQAGQMAPAMPFETADVGALPGMGMQGAPQEVLPPQVGEPGIRPQMVIDIEKASAPGLSTPAPAAPAPQAGPARPTTEQINAGIEQFLKPTEMGWKQLGSELTQAGGAYAGAAAGARLGSTFGPTGALIGGTLGAGIGAYGARQAGKAAGLTPGEPGVMPQDLQDWLSLTAPMVPGTVQLAGRPLAKVAGWTPGGKALKEATMAEHEIARLKTLPERYQPPTPSSDLYADFATRAGTKPIDLAPVTNVLADPAFQDSLKYAPRLQKVVSDLQNKGATVDAATLHELMKEVTKAGRQGDSTTRYLSGRLSGSINDAMELSIPGEKPVLDLAKSSWRQEQGVAVLEKMYGEGGNILRVDPSVPGGKSVILNVNNLLNRTATNKELPQWFSPSEYGRLQDEIKTFSGTPSKTGVLHQEPQPIKFNWVSDVLKPLSGGGLAGIAGGPTVGGWVTAGLFGIDTARHVISHVMVSPRYRAQFLNWIEGGGGPMRPELAAAFAAAAAAYHGGSGAETGAPPPGSTAGRYRPGDYTAPEAPATPVPGSTQGRYQRAY